jgi:hypothetical protein
MSIFSPDKLQSKMCNSGICTAPKPIIGFKRVDGNPDGHSDICKRIAGSNGTKDKP